MYERAALKLFHGLLIVSVVLAVVLIGMYSGFLAPNQQHTPTDRVPVCVQQRA